MGRRSHHTTRQGMEKGKGRGGTIGEPKKSDRQENEIFYDSNGDPFCFRKVCPTETVEKRISVWMLFDFSTSSSFSISTVSSLLFRTLTLRDGGLPLVPL
jgi:hypothetical protein